MYDTGPDACAFTEALGSEIRHFRSRLKLSREELADASGISASTIGRIEREGPKDVSDTWKIARALGVPLEKLIKRAEEGAQIGRIDYSFGDAPAEHEPEADAALAVLDDAVRRTRPARTRDEMRQLDDQAAHDPKPRKRS